MSDPAGIGHPAIRPALCSVGELFGGVERQLLGLVSYLGRQGLPPLLVLFHDRELAAQARRMGCEPVVLQARHPFDASASWRLADRLAAADVNLVHAHGYKAVVNCGLARLRHRFALVKTVHGKIEPARGRPLVWLKARVYARLEGLVTRRAGATVCYVTEDIRRHHRDRDRGLLQHTIYNGIEPLDRDVTRRPAELPEDRFNLLIVGRVTAVKGISLALRALASPSVPPRVCLSVAGTGPLRERLEQEAAELGLSGRVRFLGFCRNVYDYLGHADALLMPSLHEGLPYTLLEAMSLGVPILASRVGGLAEILREGQTALMFEAGDVQGIREAILRLAADPGLVAALGRNARRDQAERFTLERMGRQYLQVYREATGGLPAAGR